MCGIAGQFNFRSGAPVDAALLRRMTDRLVHRGPDDSGHLVLGPVGLGMRRLSIIDLEGGHQPMAGEDGSVQAICNGEIYNFRELRRELEGRGHVFRTKSDVEVIVHGYEEWGRRVLSRLNGMFGLALWDAGRRELLLARDRLGIKPLYWAETADGLVFASEIKAILGIPGVRTDLDLPALRQYFAWEYIPAPATPFAGIRKLPPAGRLIAGDRGVEESTWWRIEPGPPIADLREAEEGVRWHVREAVRRQKVADVPVGAFLSGGLDSSVLVACLAEETGNRLHTFSIGFEEGDFDESRNGRDVARRFGTVHEETILRPEPTLVETIADYLDEPFADNSMLPTYLVSRQARRSVKVVLSGDGGDELFGGYDRYKAARLGRWYGSLPGGIRRAIGPAGGAGRKPSKRGSWLSRARRMEEALALPPGLEHARWMVRGGALLAGGILGGSGENDAQVWAGPWIDTLRGSPFAGGLDRQLHADVRLFLADDILFKTDRASMAASLEARVPYLDHELVEYAFRIPERWKLRRLTGKWILRRAFRDRLPADVVRRRKSGFSVPVASWLRGPLRPLLEDMLAPARLRRRSVLDDRLVGRLVHDHLQGSADHGRSLWAVLMFELWHERYGRASRAADPVLSLPATGRGGNVAVTGPAAAAGSTIEVHAP